MAKVIRELAARLSLQADSFNNGIKAAQKEMKEFEKNIKPSLTLAKELGTGMTIAGGAVVAGMLAATKSAVDFGDALNDARQRTGIAVETLARFGFAAQQSGSDVGALAVGFKGLANNMQAAAAGGKVQVEAFAALGISTSQLAAANGDMEKVMLLVADRFAAMEDGAQKSALAVDIFGKAGVGLIPMLNEGSEGLKKLGDEAQAAGLVMSQETALAADKLNDTLNLMKASALGASVNIATALVPSLQSAAEFAVEGTQAFAGFIKEHQGLTTATFAAGVALTATGAALVGIAVIVPKLKLGLELLNTALLPLGIAISATQIGVVALGAALGIGIGMLANYALEVTGLQKTLDSFTTTALRAMNISFASTVDAQKMAAFTAAAVAKGWTAAKVEATNLSAATADLAAKIRTYDDFVKEGIEIQKADAAAKKELTDAAAELVKSQTDLTREARAATLELVEQRKAAYALAVQAAATASATKAMTGYLNPSAPDPAYNPHDPFGLNSKNAALHSSFSPSLSNIAAQPALPAALNLGGGGSSDQQGPPAGGNYSPAGWVNGVYYTESGRPQGTSSFGGGGVTVNSPVTVTVQRGSSVAEIQAELERGIGLEKMARTIFGAQNGIASTKGA